MRSTIAYSDSSIGQSVARDRPQTEGGDDGREGEQQGNSGRDESAEDDDQDDQRDRDRVETGLLEVIHEGSLEFLVDACVPECPDEHLWVRGLRVSQCEEDWIDLVDGEIGITADLELDYRGVAVLRDDRCSPNRAASGCA